MVIAFVKERCFSAPKRKKQLVANKILSQLEICIDLQLWSTTNCFLFRYGNLEIGHILIDVDKPRHFAASVTSSWSLFNWYIQ